VNLLKNTRNAADALDVARMKHVFRFIRGAVSGYTLIEVLVSLTLLSIMLLGMDALNLSSLRLAKSIYHQHLNELEKQNARELQHANS
jgi:prepilin-type N-terminal cleavage/methylation domain-containing protein